MTALGRQEDWEEPHDPPTVNDAHDITTLAHPAWPLLSLSGDSE